MHAARLAHHAHAAAWQVGVLLERRNTDVRRIEEK